MAEPNNEFSGWVNPFQSAPANDEFSGWKNPFESAPAAGRGPVGVAKDLGVSFASGANILLKSFGDLYGLTTGDMQNWASEQGARGREFWEARKTPQLKQMEAERQAKIDATESGLGKAGVAFWETLKSPSLLSSLLAEQVPMMLPVGAAGRAGGVLARTGGAGAKTAGAVATGAALGTGASMQGADAGSQAFEQLMAVPEDVWRSNADFMALVDRGTAPEEAKRRIATSLSRNAGIASGVVSLGLNKLPGADYLEKTLAGVKLPAASMGMGALKGFLGETVQEGLEEGSGALAANVATSRVDPNQSISEGVGQATGLGAAAGPFGAVAGVMRGRDNDPTETINRIAGAPTLDDAIAEADSILRTVTPGESRPVEAVETTPYRRPTDDPAFAAREADLAQQQEADRARAMTQRVEDDAAANAQYSGEQPTAMRQAFQRALGRQPTVPAQPSLDPLTAKYDAEARTIAGLEALEQEPASPKPIVKTNGEPFLSRRSAELSQQAKNNPGATVVEVEGGFGLMPQVIENASISAENASEINTNSVIARAAGPEGAGGARAAQSGVTNSPIERPQNSYVRRGTITDQEVTQKPAEQTTDKPPQSGQVIDATDRFEVAQRAELQRQAQADYAREDAAAKIDNAPVDSDGYARFEKESGTLAVPRAEMPQIKAEARGALVNFLKARGIDHTQEEVPASSLKPTQAEFSPAKVQQAREFTEGDRAVLVSSDGHIVDGHHQAMARGDETIRIIRLNAPIRELLKVVPEFPSAEAATDVAPAMEVEFNGKRYPVSSIQDAQAKWDQFRESARENGGGASAVGNMPVFEGGKQVAKISYNGRAWDMDGNEIGGTGKSSTLKALPSKPAPANTFKTGDRVQHNDGSAGTVLDAAGDMVTVRFDGSTNAPRPMFASVFQPATTGTEPAAQARNAPQVASSDKPLAVEGLTSYRYKGRYGWTMIGAKDDADALKEAQRSADDGKPVSADNLQVWDGGKYVAASQANAPTPKPKASSKTPDAAPTTDDTFLDKYAAQSKTLDQLKSFARGRFGRERMREMEPQIQAAWDRKQAARGQDTLFSQDGENFGISRQRAEQMFERTYNVYRESLREDGIKTWREWVDKQSPYEIALMVESEYEIYNRYLAQLPEEVTAKDIVEAYKAGTLPAAEATKARSAPLAIPAVDAEPAGTPGEPARQKPLSPKRAKSIWEIANTRASKSNKSAVDRARYEVFMQHAQGQFAEAAGVDEKAVNAKIKTWSNFKKGALELQNRLNANLPLATTWTGITNLSYLSQHSVKPGTVDQFVKEIDANAKSWGTPDGEQLRNYIMRTLLGIDTRIQYTDLKFIIDFTLKPLGVYKNSERSITIRANSPNTVAHEIGHYLDAKWGHEAGDNFNFASDSSVNRSHIVENTSELRAQWMDRFKEFVMDISERSEIGSSYYQNRKEVFARFVDKFLQWAESTAGVRRWNEDRYVGDKFHSGDFTRFVRLLQEKAYVDIADGNPLANAEGADVATEQASQSWLTAETSSPGMTVEEVTTAVAPAMEKLKQQFDLDVIVVAHPSDIGIDPKKRYRGAYHNGAVYLFADNLQSARGAQVTLAHELIGHKGVLEAVTPEEWTGIKQSIDQMIKLGSKTANSVALETDRRYDNYPRGSEGWYKEFLAVAAERRVLQSNMKSLFEKAKAMLRRILKSLGFNQVFSDSDIEIILSNSERYLRESGEAMQQEGTLASQMERGENEAAREKGLPMDKASRMARAETMGFDTKRVVYHGTANDFAGFRGATWFTSEPSAASAYAEKHIADTGNVIPAYLKIKNMATHEDFEELGFDADAMIQDDSDTYKLIAALKDAGFDGAEFTDQDAETGDLIDAWVVFDPANIRSINAAFDPNYSGSADLLASTDTDGDSALSGQPLFSQVNGDITLSWMKRNGYPVGESGSLTLYRPSGVRASKMYPTAELARRAGGEPVVVRVNADDVQPSGNGLLPRDTLFSQGAQTDTPEFKRWFGDSKVVDKNGAPQVVYHGTYREFTKFRPGTEGVLGPGIYLSKDPDEASLYAGMEPSDTNGQVIPVYVKIENPISEDDAAELESQYRSGVSREIQKRGYDGIIGHDTIVVYRPEQIKSAIGNRGTFDPNNPNILFSQGESDFQEENARIREEDKTLWNKAKREMRRQLTPAGLLPDSVFKSKIARDNKLAVVEFDAAHLIGNLERAIRRDYGVHAGKLSDADLNALSEALGGKIPASVKGQTKAALIAMREYIDAQSRQYTQILREQVANMAGNLDEAERELLRAFVGMSKIDNSTGTPAEKGAATKQRNALLDEAKAQAKELWGDGKRMQESLGTVAALAEKISLIETITANEGTYVHRSYQAFDDPEWPTKVPDKVLNNARTYLMDRLLADGDMTEQQAQRRARVIIEDILKEGTAYDNLESFIKESKLGAKDLSVLKSRKRIAPEIRALLGEHKDPRLNFAKSVTKMGRLIWNQRFLDRVREVGMGTFLFTEEDRPPNTTKIAAEGSEVYSPLNGLYAEREVVQAFKDALGKEQMANWYKAIVQLNGVVKYGKTILSPTTAMRNWQSAMFFTVANGHFDWKQMGKSVSGLREYFTHAGSGEKLAYLRKLKDLGVVYDTAYAGEMMRLLDDSAIENMIAGSDSAMGIRKALELAQKFYQYGDDFWKVIGFENEKNNLMKYGGLSKEAAEVEAAERIRNTYPTYSMVGRGVQSLRRFPLVGTFVSFPAEIIRTTFNMLKYLQKDWQNPKMRPVAVKRAVGMGMAAGFAYALQEMSKLLFDIDDDDEEAIRLQAAPWQQNSNLVFAGRDEKGNIRYFDISFLDPYSYWKRPITAITRDQPWQEQAVSAAGEMLQPFFGTDILAGAIFQVAANKKDTGGKVYKETDSVDRQLMDITNHLRKNLQPGIASNLERTWKAIQGETSSSGQKYNLHDEGLGWLGWRVTTLDPKVALYYRSFDFNDAKTDASRTLTQVLTDPNSVSTNDITDAYETAVQMRAQAYSDMQKMVSASRRSGMSDTQIRITLRGANVSQADQQALLNGTVPRWMPTVQSERSAVRRAEAILGPEKAAEIRRRYQTVRKQAAQ